MELSAIRQQIDQLDDQLIDLFRQRLKLVEQVATIKAEKKLPLLDPQREREIINRLTQAQNDTFAGYTQKLLTTIFELSRTHQVLTNNPQSASPPAR